MMPGKGEAFESVAVGNDMRLLGNDQWGLVIGHFYFCFSMASNNPPSTSCVALSAVSLAL